MPRLRAIKVPHDDGHEPPCGPRHRRAFEAIAAAAIAPAPSADAHAQARRTKRWPRRSPLRRRGRCRRGGEGRSRPWSYPARFTLAAHRAGFVGSMAMAHQASSRDSVEHPVSRSLDADHADIQLKHFDKSHDPAPRPATANRHEDRVGVTLLVEENEADGPVPATIRGSLHEGT